MKITVDSETVSAATLEAVRFSFNPSAIDRVAVIKLLAAALIEECAKIRADGNAYREASIAITETESAAMWAVKAATAGQPK